MQVLTRIRRTKTGTDQYGEPIYATTSIDLPAKVAPRTGSKEFGAAEVTVTSGLTAYLKSGTDIENDDVFVYKSQRYVLDGEAFDWEAPFHMIPEPGVVINLQKESNG